MNMPFRIVRVTACLTVILLPWDVATAEEPPRLSAASAANNLFGLGEMAQAAADLHEAGKAFERFGNSLEEVAATIAESLAKMSRGFDPLGYQAAFRTIGEQTEIIQQQDAIIRELLEREIERLQDENKALRKRESHHRKKRQKGRE